MSTKNDSSNNCPHAPVSMCGNTSEHELWMREVFKTTSPQRYTIPSGYDPSMFDIKDNDRCMNDYLLRYLIEEIDRKLWDAPPCSTEKTASFITKTEANKGLPFWEISEEAKAAMVRQIQENAALRSALFLEGVMREEERTRIVYAAYGSSILDRIFGKKEEDK